MHITEMDLKTICSKCPYVHAGCYHMEKQCPIFLKKEKDNIKDKLEILKDNIEHRKDKTSKKEEKDFLEVQINLVSDIIYKLNN